MSQGSSGPKLVAAVAIVAIGTLGWFGWKWIDGPEHHEATPSRPPASLLAQPGSERPIAVKSAAGFNSFMQKIVRDAGLEVVLDAKVIGVEPQRPGSIRVTFTRGAGDRAEARIMALTSPSVNAPFLRHPRGLG